MFLSTNKESRYVANQEYPHSFGTATCVPNIRFNFARDTLFLAVETIFYRAMDIERDIRKASTIIPHLAQNDLNRVKSLAVKDYVSQTWIFRLLYELLPTFPRQLEFISKFLNLDTLMIVAVSTVGPWDGKLLHDACSCKWFTALMADMKSNYNPVWCEECQCSGCDKILPQKHITPSLKRLKAANPEFSVPVLKRVHKKEAT